MSDPPKVVVMTPATSLRSSGRDRFNCGQSARAAASRLVARLSPGTGRPKRGSIAFMAGDPITRGEGLLPPVPPGSPRGSPSSPSLRLAQIEQPGPDVGALGLRSGSGPRPRIMSRSRASSSTARPLKPNAESWSASCASRGNPRPPAAVRARASMSGYMGNFRPVNRRLHLRVTTCGMGPRRNDGGPLGLRLR